VARVEGAGQGLERGGAGEGERRCRRHGSLYFPATSRRTAAASLPREWGRGEEGERRNDG
jgi:hypothetical protein